MRKGWKVALASMEPSLVSSLKPMIEATAVHLMICTEKPTVGAIDRRSACGSTTCRICCRQPMARLDEASHWPLGMDSTQPRQDRKSTRLNSSHLVISYA